jgi:hypothetical protein
MACGSEPNCAVARLVASIHRKRPLEVREPDMVTRGKSSFTSGAEAKSPLAVHRVTVSALPINGLASRTAPRFQITEPA